MNASLKTQAERLAEEIAGQAETVDDLNDLMRLMMKSTLQRMLDTEMDVHLGRRPSVFPAEAVAEESTATTETPLSTETQASSSKKRPNRRNGRSKKTVRSEMGKLDISTPRDRDGTFEPLLIGKHQRRVPGFDEKILALYAKGMTTRDIQEIVRELYGVEISATLVSEITADLDAEVTAWRTRPLEPVWPIVYFDGIVVHVRGRWPREETHDLRGFRREFGGLQGVAGAVARRDRGRQVLVELFDRPEEPRPDRHLRGVYRRAERFRRCDPRGLPASERATVHRPSRPRGVALRGRQGLQGGDPRPEEDLSSGDGRRGRTSFGRIR